MKTDPVLWALRIEKRATGTGTYIHTRVGTYHTTWRRLCHVGTAPSYSLGEQVPGTRRQAYTHATLHTMSFWVVVLVKSESFLGSIFRSRVAYTWSSSRHQVSTGAGPDWKTWQREGRKKYGSQLLWVWPKLKACTKAGKKE